MHTVLLSTSFSLSPPGHVDFTIEVKHALSSGRRTFFFSNDI